MLVDHHLSQVHLNVNSLNVVKFMLLDARMDCGIDLMPKFERCLALLRYPKRLLAEKA
jgi:hypothetical protein